MWGVTSGATCAWQHDECQTHRVSGGHIRHDSCAAEHTSERVSKTRQLRDWRTLLQRGQMWLRNQSVSEQDDAYRVYWLVPGSKLICLTVRFILYSIIDSLLLWDYAFRGQRLQRSYLHSSQKILENRCENTFIYGSVRYNRGINLCLNEVKCW